MLRSATALSVLAAIAVGCATATTPRQPAPSAPVPAAATSAPSPVDEALRDPAQLLALGRAALESRDLDLAYRYYALVHLLHPKSDQDAEAFPWAAGVFKRRFEETRWTDKTSVWQTSEPVFLMQWLDVSFFAGAKSYPEQAVADLLKGTPYELGVRFVEQSRQWPSLSQWQYTIEDDNGRIVAVHGARTAK